MSEHLSYFYLLFRCTCIPTQWVTWCHWTARKCTLFSKCLCFMLFILNLVFQRWQQHTLVDLDVDLHLLRRMIILFTMLFMIVPKVYHSHLLLFRVNWLIISTSFTCLRNMCYTFGDSRISAYFLQFLATFMGIDIWVTTLIRYLLDELALTWCLFYQFFLLDLNTLWLWFDIR